MSVQKTDISLEDPHMNPKIIYNIFFHTNIKHESGFSAEIP